MSSISPRIPPVDPGNFDEEQRALVGDWANLNFSRVIVRSPALYRAFVPLIDRLIRGSILPARDREVLVFRTLAFSGELYETHHHRLIAEKTGMSESEIEAIRGNGAGLSDFDRLLMTAAEELVKQQGVTDATWSALAERYSPEQLMEVVALVGCYTMMAMVTNSFQIPLEEGSAVFDDLAQLRKYT